MSTQHVPESLARALIMRAMRAAFRKGEPVDHERASLVCFRAGEAAHQPLPAESGDDSAALLNMSVVLLRRPDLRLALWNELTLLLVKSFTERADVELTPEQFVISDYEMPYQARVVTEFQQLSARLRALLAFMGSEAFGAVDPEERQRLMEQAVAMEQLAKILRARVVGFGPPKAAAARG